MGKHADVHTSTTAQLLDETYEQKFISATDHQRFKVGYQTQGVFIDSPRLNTFQYDFSSAQPDGPDAARSLHPGTKALVGLGIAATGYDAITTYNTASALSAESNYVGAQSEILRFGATNIERLPHLRMPLLKLPSPKHKKPALRQPIPITPNTKFISRCVPAWSICSNVTICLLMMTKSIVMRLP